jgi:hypothetical protein
VATIAQRLRDDYHVEVSESTVRALHRSDFHRAAHRRQGHRGAGRCRTGQRSPNRLRQAGHVARPGVGGPGRGVGVRDDRVVFDSAVRATGVEDGSVIMERLASQPSSSSAGLVCDNLKTGVDRPEPCASSRCGGEVSKQRRQQHVSVGGRGAQHRQRGGHRIRCLRGGWARRRRRASTRSAASELTRPSAVTMTASLTFNNDKTRARVGLPGMSGLRPVRVA